MDKKQPLVATKKTDTTTTTKEEQQYMDSLSEIEQIGVQVAYDVIPHVYCLSRCCGFQKWKQKQQPPTK